MVLIKSLLFPFCYSEDNQKRERRQGHSSPRSLDHVPKGSEAEAGWPSARPAHCPGISKSAMPSGAAFMPQTSDNFPPVSELQFFLNTGSYEWDSLTPQLVKNPPAMQENPVPFLGPEDLLEKG